jgi:hypothetical protein
MVLDISTIEGVTQQAGQTYGRSLRLQDLKSVVSIDFAIFCSYRYTPLVIELQSIIP